ncbi:MAG TPA: CrcB family protein [Solirubrobacteraceae bacterium]|nr:CrcB family protein [Solirubrobacteraceae bacterium]
MRWSASRPDSPPSRSPRTSCAARGSPHEHAGHPRDRRAGRRGRHRPLRARRRHRRPPRSRVPLRHARGQSARSFLLGVFVGAALSADTYRLVGTGLVGAFTTFSAWMLESHRLGEDGELARGFANFALSLVLGLSSPGPAVTCAMGCGSAS